MLSEDKDKRAIEQATKLKNCLEGYSQMYNEKSLIDGINLCQRWIEVIVSGEENNVDISILERKFASLPNDNHVFEELKYEFKKWLSG